jgi:RimJ/RimL family protein N-acetyltransferase
LVPVDPDRHLEGCTRWLNDPRVNRTLAVGALPLTKMAEREWLERMAKGPQTDAVFAIELIEDGRHIGMSGIHGISWIHRSATTGSLIGEVELWGEGLGSEQARLRARYAFLTLNLRVLYSEFICFNDASRKMQLAAGYEIWGTKPKAYYKDGEYHDAIQTALTRERWAEFSVSTPTDGTTEG